jgi:ADP-ribosylglycohydrolase
MRIAPLALFLNCDQPADRRVIRDVCRITHRNDEAYVGALAVLRAMQFSRPVASPPERIAAIAGALPDTNVRDALETLAALPVESSARDAAAVIGTSGYVAHSVPLAIFIASRAVDLETAILDAVGCGGDTDTVGSMVGQILGARGHQVPPQWIARIPCAAEILELTAGD